MDQCNVDLSRWGEPDNDIALDDGPLGGRRTYEGGATGPALSGFCLVIGEGERQMSLLSSSSTICAS